MAEVVGGIVAGSLALLSDALHNFTDTASQIVSYVAMSIAGRPATNKMTFGYKRFEVVAAFFNLVVLFVVALLLAKEGVERLLDPQPIRGEVMLAVAMAGLLVNLGSALLLRSGAKQSLNIRSAYLHIVTDAFSSVAVVMGAVLVLTFNLTLVDPILTVAISAYILFHGYGMLKGTVRILMNSAPPDVDLDRVKAAIQMSKGVVGVHHLHVWLMDEHAVALEAHVVMDRDDMQQMEEIKAEIKHRLREDFAIVHSTLEFEHKGLVESASCREADVMPDR